ncbi:hypothetical protein O181_064199 [Austropuccinia psidii MF-1]|uniref:Gag-Pol-p199 n=1 Tax=Austropuccinia psidii MF-1 TaxID=1389203 RepID=A0A9Q3I3A5_9BASI|nr:hypothetical protein [Austropuccinia psidii MF-1]
MDPSTTSSGKKFSSDQPKSNPDDITGVVSLNINDNDAVSHVDKQAESLHRFSLIADKIYPRLVLDGNNFMAWSCNLFSTWNNYFFDDPNYFEINTRDSAYRRNLVALTFLQNSINRSLYESITLALVTPNAHTTYQALKKQFCKASWSSIIRHAEILFNPPDCLTTLTSHAVALQHAINNIESQIGAVNSKTILTLTLFFSAQQFHEPLLNALDSRKAIDPSLEIHAQDIVVIANRMQQHPTIDSSSSITLSQMDANSNTPDLSWQSKLTPKTSHGPSLTPSTLTSSSNSICIKPEEWKKKWLTAKNPCFDCGQVGHWLPNCPTKVVVDQMKHQHRKKVVVASIAAMPLPGCRDALLDSGATHSVFDAATGILPHHLPDVKLCNHCSISKREHRPVQAPSWGSIKAPGALILADLIGPLPCSIEDKRYVLVVQDFLTRLKTAIPISDKAEAKIQLQHWMICFSNTCSLQIKAVRTDNGSEFKNHFFNDFLLKHGIEHEYSMPYEHHQNGRIKRKNCMQLEIARTCLIGGNLPVKLWSYAFKHATWIFNQTLHFDCKKTPYELIRKQKPSFHLLRVFGAKVYIYNHTFKKDFSLNVFVGYHLGVASDSKGWLFWCPEKDTIVRSASAKFDKSYFFPTKPNVSSIQALNLLDDVMIKELETQYRMISTITSYPDPVSINPTHYRDIINLPERDSWLLAVEEELASLNEQDVFEVIEMKDALHAVKNEDILSTRWVFRKKHHPNRFKARLVAQGFRQTKDINFSETFAPTLNFGALRLTYTLNCNQGQALLWEHVDDVEITASSQDLLDSISVKINSHLKIKWDKEVAGLVGLNIEPSPGGYYISQAELIDKIINLNTSNITARLPIPPNTSLTSGSRPDSTYAVNYLAHFSLCTNQLHWQVLEHLIAYLRYTPHCGLQIGASKIHRGFECYVDTNWGGEGDCSCHGFILLDNGNLISWKAKRQITVASSTCQAEYIALSFVSKECLWLSHLFLPVLGQIVLKIYSDNKAAISIADNTASQKQTRHLIREFNITNEYIITKKIELLWVLTHDQLAEIFTKALGQLKVNSFVKAIGSKDAG